MSLAEIHRTATAPITGRLSPLSLYAVLTLLMTVAIVAGFVMSLSTWTLGALVAVPLVALTALWISGGAATAILGLFTSTPRLSAAPQGWTPSGPTAILVTTCGEDPAPLAQALGALRAALDRAGLDTKTQIFVLSDTSGPQRICAEEHAFEALHASQRITYRRRAQNLGRKPGNIADWLATHGDHFAYMMVLDADSRMAAQRIRNMIWQMEHRPNLGLLQAGIGLVPGETRFGCHQRVAARVLSRNFGRGFAAWSGDSGNYWGHNAIIRVAAFRKAAALPQLSGPAPFGGHILSHDFIEAAWIRRAGWAVALDPDPSRSAESAPQTLAEFHRRDRRWCQGNLQHLRLLAEPDLCPVSRLHLAAGVISYLAAPLWLILIVLIAAGTVPVDSAVPLLVVALVLLLPKFCALIDWWSRARTVRRRLIALRALMTELFASSLVAPLIMVRHAASVASVCMGRDCGWKSARKPSWNLPDGLPEVAVGIALVVMASLANASALLWLAPVVVPLCAAPLIARIMNAPA